MKTIDNVVLRTEEGKDDGNPASSLVQVDPSDCLSGAALIGCLVEQMPSTPGVYQMLGDGGKVLYIGKANNIKKRVSSYTSTARHGNRIARMISKTRNMRYTITRTETDALLLEASLIKQLRPKYNVLLQDDKSFPYILLANDHPAPRILKHRGGLSREGDYFGPFASVSAVNQTLRLLQRAFLLRSCSDSVYSNRTRPCLLYQIKCCSAPCVGKISLKDYMGLTKEANDFLRGRSHRLQEELSEKMLHSSKSLDFEGAAVLRDRIAALARIQSRQHIHPYYVREADVFAACKDAGRVCIEAFFFRAGQNWGNREYFPLHGSEQDVSEVLDAFLGQFYENHEPPKLILLNREVTGQKLLSEALSIRCGRGVKVITPRRGEKHELVVQAQENAQEALGRYLARFADRRTLLKRLCEVFGLDSPPRRIEIYDNSHIQGVKPVGAMVVAGEEGFRKKEYRKFTIATTEYGDDYAMMREMLNRRFSRLSKTEKGDEFPARPDLLLIDGGAGQLAAAVDAMKEANMVDCTPVAIAKGKERNAGQERFFLPGRDSFQLDVQDPLLYYLQSLRDEAHRFAIGFHRDKRSMSLRESVLDEIPGIGSQRKRALLHFFGSKKMIARASYEDLAKVPGISSALAWVIYEHFREIR